MNQKQLMLEQRIRKIEDELEIRNLAARFTDAVNERDIEAFRKVWAENAVWEIGEPRFDKAVGVDAIVVMFSKALDVMFQFVQLTHSGVIEFVSDDRATARFTEYERGKLKNDYYQNIAVYRDELIRTNEGWKFLSRNYQYRYLDTSVFSGEMISSKAKSSV